MCHEKIVVVILCTELTSALYLPIAEPHSTVATRGSVSSDLSAGSPPSSSTHSPSPPSCTAATAGKTDRKAATLYLTDEEKRLLAAEGVSLPTDMPLTKVHQKQNSFIDFTFACSYVVCNLHAHGAMRW